jgi:hypothetical protein
MPKVTLWIATNVQDKFAKEENKSGLINRLLARHYEGPLNTTIKEVQGIINGDANLRNDALKIKASMPSMDRACKKCGFNLNKFGKCSQKDCNK